jgi:hypothetical protein
MFSRGEPLVLLNAASLNDAAELGAPPRPEPQPAFSRA